MVDLLVNRAIKVNWEPGKQDATDDVRMDVDLQLSALVQHTVFHVLPVSLRQANTLLSDRIQDPLVGLTCQQLICDRSVHHSPVPIEEVFIVPGVFSKRPRVSWVNPTFANVLCDINILCRLVEDMKLTYFIAEQEKIFRFAASARYRHLLAQFHCQGRWNELF